MNDERFTEDWDALAYKLGYHSKFDMLHDLYIVQGLSFNQIGQRLGCGPHCVGRNLEKVGIKRRGRGGANSVPNQTRKLFLLDQRVVLLLPFGQSVKYCRVSTALLHRYRNLMKGVQNGVLHNQPDDRPGEVFETE